jgi:hypothetical protein
MSLVSKTNFRVKQARIRNLVGPWSQPIFLDDCQVVSWCESRVHVRLTVIKRRQDERSDWGVWRGRGQLKLDSRCPPYPYAWPSGHHGRYPYWTSPVNFSSEYWAGSARKASEQLISVWWTIEEISKYNQKSTWEANKLRRFTMVFSFAN